MKLQLTKRSAVAAIATVAALATITVGATGEASPNRTKQDAAVNWHPQSGNAGAVGDNAHASLVRSSSGIRYRFDTTDLVAGNAYTMWLVVVNDPAACDATPCAAPQIIGDPLVDGQVAWGLDGEVARRDGVARFRARIEAGPLLDGWIQVQGLDDPMGAEIHLIVNDHGPVIHGLGREMLSTYRAGCADSSPFPPFFPASALADGTPGPNTCRLYQSAVFESPTT
ncbi:MAG: hypothetical protein WBL31_10370 [Ilumatobacteraceae bacterium]